MGGSKRKYTDEQRKEREKARNKVRVHTPEVKAYHKEYLKKYYADPEKKAKALAQKREYRSRPENIEKIKARNKIYYKTPEYKERKKKLRSTPEYKEKQKVYNQTPDYIARRKARSQSIEYKQKRQEVYSKPENRAKTKTHFEKLKFELFSHYSKKQNDADFPVCACCLYHDIRALNIDHITPHSKLSASEKLIPRGGNVLWAYLKKNNFPIGYQVLCANCNSMKLTKPECPHQLDKVRTYCQIVELKK